MMANRPTELPLAQEALVGLILAIARERRLPARAWPLAAAAQHIDPMRRIGVLVAYAEGDPEMQARLVAFRQGLEQLGWCEGRNIRFDIRFAPAGTGQEHSASLAATFEGEFSDVTRSYAGKGVARYSR